MYRPHIQMNKEIFDRLSQAKDLDVCLSTDPDKTGAELSTLVSEALAPYRGRNGEFQSPGDQLRESVYELLCFIDMHHNILERRVGTSMTPDQTMVAFARQAVDNYILTR